MFKSVKPIVRTVIGCTPAPTRILAIVILPELRLGECRLESSFSGRLHVATPASYVRQE
jgi:hypothetical protein